MNEKEKENGIDREVVLRPAEAPETVPHLPGNGESALDLDRLYNPW